MFTVYILRNIENERHYIGSTNDIKRRIKEHNRRHTRSTRHCSNWSLIYKEEYKTSIEAKKREKLIKSFKGGNAFKKLITRV